jgi:GNAT superfamily N-acetyltransferase
LTSAGVHAWRDLDARSDELATRLIEPLSARQQAALTEALAAADRLLRLATVRFDAVDPHDDEAQWAMKQYFSELDARFPSGFDHGDALDEGAATMRAPTGAFVVAHDDVTPIACGGVQRIDDHTGEIKRMWVEPAWRGTGLGRRTLAHLEERVRALGYERVVLDTNATLTEAIAMYQRAGYHPIGRYNDNPYAERWFAKHLG